MPDFIQNVLQFITVNNFYTYTHLAKVHWILKTNIFFLSVSAGRTVFTSFLKSEFSEENMDFWVACEDYKKTSPSERASRAKQIYQQYVEADGPREVMTFIWNRR